MNVAESEFFRSSIASSVEFLIQLLSRDIARKKIFFNAFFTLTFGTRLFGKADESAKRFLNLIDNKHCPWAVLENSWLISQLFIHANMKHLGSYESTQEARVLLLLLRFSGAFQISQVLHFPMI